MLVATKKAIHACPLCGCKKASASGLASHVKSCRYRPDDDELREMLAEGLSARAIAARLRVSEHSVRTFIADADLDYATAPSRTRQVTADLLDLLPGLAPMRGASCLHCEMAEKCHWDQEQGIIQPWLMCEAPEVDLVRSMARRWPIF